MNLDKLDKLIEYEMPSLSRWQRNKIIGLIRSVSLSQTEINEWINILHSLILTKNKQDLLISVWIEDLKQGIKDVRISGR
jgi:hypothetical protein